MIKQLLALGFAFLLFGCLAQPYSDQGQPPAQPTAPPSGNVTPPANVSPPAQTPPANVTPPPAPQQNQSPAAPPPVQPQEQPVERTNLSVADLLNAGINKLPYPSGGPYFTRTYQWVLNEFDSSDAKDIVLNPTLNVLFDNKTENNLVGFAFTTYAPSGGNGSNLTTANGIAIVYNGSLRMDGYVASGMQIEIEYNADPMPRTLQGATVVSKEVLVNQKNRTIAIYTFESGDVK